MDVRKCKCVFVLASRAGSPADVHLCVNARMRVRIRTRLSLMAPGVPQQPRRNSWSSCGGRPLHHRGRLPGCFASPPPHPTHSTVTKCRQTLPSKQWQRKKRIACYICPYVCARTAHSRLINRNTCSKPGVLATRRALSAFRKVLSTKAEHAAPLLIVVPHDNTYHSLVNNMHITVCALRRLWHNLHKSVHHPRMIGQN